jgi:hypothetical protein
VDHFQSCSTSGWDEGQTRGQWSLAFDGYGNVGVGRAGDNKLLYQEPTTATAPEKTHASMVLSTKAFQGVDMTLRQKTARQLKSVRNRTSGKSPGSSGTIGTIRTSTTSS